MATTMDSVLPVSAKRVADSKIIPGNPYELGIVDSAKKKMQARLHKHWEPNQALGRRDTIGCVALEITQRCNLDCTLCYLSEHSEDTRDIPMAELFRRLDEIKDTYGPGVGVQITGGDPTMRKYEELVEIVRYARNLGLVPALFTNGIKATREMLIDLAKAGLGDVAFHVDLTQERKGYRTEKELNAVRKEYIERARGLGISVLFNTTVHRENIHEIPDIVRFFRANTDVVTFCSFQMQAETGRGELGSRDADAVTVPRVRSLVSEGAGIPLQWDLILYGHPDCNRMAGTLATNGNLYNTCTDQTLFNDFLREFAHIRFDRRQPTINLALPYLKAIWRKPSWLFRGLAFVFGLVWQAKWDLLKSGFKVNRLCFFIHNFMDAKNLDQDRIDACSFMVQTPDGPISMCAHNADRDRYILRPIEVREKDGSVKVWDPLGDKGDAIRAKMQLDFTKPSGGNCAGCGGGCVK
jgi:7,8-dihydro-6-hydroxymethylpterin dimethyltransferase